MMRVEFLVLGKSHAIDFEYIAVYGQLLPEVHLIILYDFQPRHSILECCVLYIESITFI